MRLNELNMSEVEDIIKFISISIQNNSDIKCSLLKHWNEKLDLYNKNKITGSELGNSVYYFVKNFK